MSADRKMEKRNAGIAAGGIQNAINDWSNQERDDAFREGDNHQYRHTRNHQQSVRPDKGKQPLQLW
jgi:hypothetical protein